MSSTIPPTSKTSTPVVTPAADNSAAPTDVINAQSTPSQAPAGTTVARNLSTSQLDNLRGYAERGDMQGVQNYLDCGAVLTLLNALRDRDETNAKLDALTGERNAAVEARKRINDMFAPLLK